jgi:hypothetical protein
VPTQKRNTVSASQTSSSIDMADQFRVLCQDLLDRHPLRRGPYIIPDSDLRETLRSRMLAQHSRRPAVSE